MGTTEALERVASGPYGSVLVVALAAGLAGYVVWRMVQAVKDPGHDRRDRWKGIAMRLFYFASGVLYAVVAYEAVLMGLGSGGGGGGGSSRGVVFLILGGLVAHGALTHDPSSGTGGQDQALEAVEDYPWLLGLIGAGLFCYAIDQWVKARYRLIGVDD